MVGVLFAKTCGVNSAFLLKTVGAEVPRRGATFPGSHSRSMAGHGLTPGLSGPESALHSLPISPRANATGDPGSPLGQGECVKLKGPGDTGPFLSHQLRRLPPSLQSPCPAIPVPPESWVSASSSHCSMGLLLYAQR